MITHDRWFLDRVATHILAFEGDSQVTWFEGDWGEYAEWVRETRGPEALEPHRIKYKPLDARVSTRASFAKLARVPPAPSRSRSSCACSAACSRSSGRRPTSTPCR